MMRKTITRTLTRATIESFTVKMVEGKPVVEALSPVVAWGKITEKEAVKAVEEAHGKMLNLNIGGITFEDITFEISVDAFVANAKVVEGKTDSND